MNIPFSKISWGPEEEEAVIRVGRSGWLAPGKEVAAFEQEFAHYIAPRTDDGLALYDVPYCIFTNSCTSALKMAYKYKKENIPGRFIIYPDNTFCATYSAAEEMGLDSYPLSQAQEIEEEEAGLFPEVDRVVVHYGSIKDNSPCLIEDSAHRIEQNDPLVGKIRCYSFYATKNMTTGSGGMFVTKDKEIYEQARLWWKDGLTTSTADRAGGPVDYEVKAMAGGYDGNDLAAAIGRVQLKKLPEFTRRRGEIRDRYNQALGQTWMGNHLYCYFVDSEAEVASLRQFLHDNGIGSGYHYPGTGWLGVSLPIYPLLTDEEQEYIIEKVQEWNGNFRVRNNPGD